MKTTVEFGKELLKRLNNKYPSNTFSFTKGRRGFNNADVLVICVNGIPTDRWMDGIWLNRLVSKEYMNSFERFTDFERYLVVI